MSAADLLLSSRRVVTPKGVMPAALLIRHGRIAEVRETVESGIESAWAHRSARVPEPQTIDEPAKVDDSDGTCLDLGDLVLMPGVVDVHVHVNEPGRTDWEGFETASEAAAAGGVTTIVDMPLNCSPVTVSVPALEEKARRAAARCRVNYGFWGGLVPGNVDGLGSLLEAGALGFKCFLAPSGIDEFPHVDEADLRRGMEAVARLGAVLLVHAELAGPIDHATRAVAPGACASPRRARPRAYASYLALHPPEAEVGAIERLIRLSRQTGCAAHVVHLSAAEALGPLRRAREDGVPITVETAPHYLTFRADDVPDGATRFKCAPPIRTAADRERLWEGLDAGVIDLIATDHSPCPPRLKREDSGDFEIAWGGVSSLGLGLSAVWTEASSRGFDLRRVTEWLCEAPARLAGLDRRKGRIAPGYDADLVAWNPEAAFEVEPSRLLCRHKLTPYEGRRLAGVVERTWIRGEPVYGDGVVSGSRRGRWERREQARAG